MMHQLLRRACKPWRLTWCGSNGWKNPWDFEAWHNYLICVRLWRVDFVPLVDGSQMLKTRDSQIVSDCDWVHGWNSSQNSSCGLAQPRLACKKQTGTAFTADVQFQLVQLVQLRRPFTRFHPPGAIPAMLRVTNAPRKSKKDKISTGSYESYMEFATQNFLPCLPFIALRKTCLFWNSVSWLAFSDHGKMGDPNFTQFTSDLVATHGPVQKSPNQSSLAPPGQAWWRSATRQGRTWSGALNNNRDGSSNWVERGCVEVF
jgi:hypothetical protein